MVGNSKPSQRIKRIPVNVVSEGKEAFPYPSAGPAPCPAVTPRRRSEASAIFNVAIWEEKKQNVLLFTSNLVVRWGPLPGRNGSINFAPTCLFCGLVLRSEARGSFP